jgi:argininosuccinate lyase
VIGKLVAYALDQQRTFRELTIDEFRKFSDRFGPDTFEVLNLDRAISRRTTIGAPSLESVAAELERWKSMLR